MVRLMVEVETIGTGDPDEVGDLPIGFGHMRFVMAVQVNHRGLFLDAVGDRWVSSYMRCIDHLRRLLAHLPAPLVSQRLAFMALFMNSGLAAREAAFEADPSGGGLWGRPYALDNLISAICGALDAPLIPELETRGPD
ncbi:hypothetical protein ACFQ4K_11330 [Tistrella bauzanensis]